MQRERRKRISVTFVKDDDVVQHIIPIEEKKSERQRRAAKRRSVNYTAGVDASGRKKKLGKCDDDYDKVDDSSDEDENPSHLTALSLQDEALAGQEVFSFRTPKKSGQMALKASEIRDGSTPNTPARGRGHLKKSSQSGSKDTTPARKGQPSKSSNQGRAPQTTTPYRLRKRNIEVDDSSEDDSVGEESSDVESDDDEEDKQTIKRKAPQDLTTNAEEYFDLHSSAPVTSDRTLSRLELPQMDVDVLRDTLDKAGMTHTKHRKSLCSQHQQMFRHWMFSMCNGFNVLLYGLGSKRDMLERFRSQYLTEFSHLVVNGYFPSLTVKQILSSITEDILGHVGSFRSPLDQVEFIKQRFDSQDYEDFYLIIHNIDGAMLRGEKTQNVLSMLAQISGIHIVASVDHINSPLIWDQTKCSRFRWIWQDVTTYAQYLAETSYENSLLVQQTGGLALRSLAHVMRSLTPNARKIFELLAQYQLENCDNSMFIGMSFQDLYVRCRESFLVNSDQTLRAQLVEFRDHKLIRAKKNFDGVEHLMIPIESSALKEFLDQGDNK